MLKVQPILSREEKREERLTTSVEAWRTINMHKSIKRTTPIKIITESTLYSVPYQSVRCIIRRLDGLSGRESEDDVEALRSDRSGVPCRIQKVSPSLFAVKLFQTLSNSFKLFLVCFFAVEPLEKAIGRYHGTPELS